MRSELLAAVSLAALVSALAVSNASAADLTMTAAPPVMAPADWSGFYAGVGVGGTFAAQPTTYTDDPTNPKTAKSLGDIDLSNVFGVVEAGYDMQSDKFVFGITANYDFHVGADGTTFVKDPETSVTETLGNIWGVGGRVGMLVNDSTLVFVSAGYAGTSLDVDVVKKTTNTDTSFNLNGYYAGAGLQTKLTDNLSLKAEYRYNSFGSGFATGVIDPTNTAAFVSGTGLVVQQVRGSLDWHF